MALSCGVGILPALAGRQDTGQRHQNHHHAENRKPSLEPSCHDQDSHRSEDQGTASCGKHRTDPPDENARLGTIQRNKATTMQARPDRLDRSGLLDAIGGPGTLLELRKQRKADCTKQQGLQQNEIGAPSIFLVMTLMRSAGRNRRRGRGFLSAFLSILKLIH